MKKRILLTSLMSYCFASVFAQNVNTGKLVNETTRTTTVPSVVETHSVQVGTKKKTPLFKTTAAPFVTEDFSSGTASTLPTGWTSSGTTAACTWKWRKTACTGAYNVGVLNSTTAANGWMVFDSDSIGSVAGVPAVFTGSMTSPAYNCSGHATVLLKFQEHFRRFQDTCYVDVTNNGTTWTTYSVTANNGIATNAYLNSNPYTQAINISATAANQASVKIRFRYINTYAGGSYNWLVDDISLSELENVEVGIDQAGFAMKGYTAGAFTSFGTIPSQFVDSIIPVITATNNGSQTVNNLAVNANVYNGATSIYSNTATLSSMVPASASYPDSTIEFPFYYNNAAGNYSLVYNINPSGDADATNNQDTITYSVNDTLYHRLTGATQGSYYIHRPAGTSTETSYNIGNTFEIPVGKSDTLTGITAAFQSTTTAGSKVVANIFKFNSGSSTWDYMGGSIDKTLTAADISTTGNVVFTRFTLDAAIQPFVMDAGEWAIVIAGKNVPTSSTVLLLYCGETSPSSLGFLHGVGDTSLNDGFSGFGGTGNLPFKVNGSPLVRLHFYKIIGISEVNPFTVDANVYPNPARNEVTVSYTTTEAAKVTISVANTMGQTVKMVNAGQNPAGNTGKSTINVADLAQGVYFCTIEANGQRATKRIVVAH